MVAERKISAKKERANRLNARKSTGPRTPEGKEHSAQNARTHGVFCQDLLLDGEAAEEFNDIRRQFIADLRPQNLLELSLVERVAEGNWRLMRLCRHEVEEERWNQKCRKGEQKDDNWDWSEAELQKFTLLTHLCSSGRSLSAGAFRAAGKMRGAFDGPVDPFGPARQRVEQSIGRALRELRSLRACNHAADLPPSPYLNEVEEQPESDRAAEDVATAENVALVENPQNEPTASEAPASDGPAESCPPLPVHPETPQGCTGSQGEDSEQLTCEEVRSPEPGNPHPTSPGGPGEE
jgi:hypothetical protein